MRFFILGSFTWLIYLHLALDYPLTTFVANFPLTDFGRAHDWSHPALADFLLSLVGAFAFYLAAFRILRRRPTDKRFLWLVLAFATLYAITLLFMYPITSTDIFEYVFHSRIWVHYGQNPLAVPPMTFTDDPFLKTVNWARHPSPYGPLWVLLTVPGSAISGNDLILNLLLMQALPVLFFLGSALVIAAILRYENPVYQTRGVLLFAWNPRVLFEATGNGHNDIIMMFFALSAIYLLVRKRRLWVMPVLVASVLVKYITAILLFPFQLYCWHVQLAGQERSAYLAKTLGLAVLLSALVMLPFLAIPSGLLEEANFYSLLAVPTLAYNVLKSIHGDRVAKISTISVSVMAYLLVYVLSLRMPWRESNPRRLNVLATWLLTAYLAIACMHFQPWFTIWPIAMGIWIDHALVRRVLVVFAASALLSYAANCLWIWDFSSWQNLQVNEMFVAVIFLPPLLIRLISRLQTGRFSAVANEATVG